MKLYLVNHKGIYLGGMTIVVASNEVEARAAAERELLKHWPIYDVIELGELTGETQSFQIWDGNY